MITTYVISHRNLDTNFLSTNLKKIQVKCLEPTRRIVFTMVAFIGEEKQPSREWMLTYEGMSTSHCCEVHSATFLAALSSCLFP